MGSTNLIFSFAKATEVTDLAFRVNSEYKTIGYSRIFIVPDVLDYHVLRVLPNVGDNYESVVGKFILEYNMVPKSRTETPSIARISKILSEDEFDNWSYFVFDSIEEVLDRVDQGYGINNLKT